MSSNGGIGLQGELQTLETRVERHSRVLDELWTESGMLRAELHGMRTEIQDLNARQRRTIWRACAVASALAPMLAELVSLLK